MLVTQEGFLVGRVMGFGVPPPLIAVLAKKFSEARFLMNLVVHDALAASSRAFTPAPPPLILN